MLPSWEMEPSCQVLWTGALLGLVHGLRSWNCRHAELQVGNLLAVTSACMLHLLNS